MNSNYLVNLRCPHCDSPVLCAISGFGSSLSTRRKECSKCGKSYIVQLYASTSPDDSVIVADGDLSSLTHRMVYLNRQRREAKAALLIKFETARKLNKP